MIFVGAGGFKPSSNFTGSETAANLNPTNAKTVTVTAVWKSNDPAIPTGACSGSYTQVNINLAQNASQGFDYTGNVQCAYLQKEGYYKLEVWGAQGGSSGTGDKQVGGYGGYAYGNIYSEASSGLYVVVGQNRDTCAETAYNGGGYGQNTTDCGKEYGHTGGGATHISIVNCGELKNCSAYQGTYNSSLQTYDGGKILIVAGGGGGSDNSHGYAGSGGGYIGGRASASSGATGGSQTAGGAGAQSGSFGTGDLTTSTKYGGGGGGWYGGGSGLSSNNAGAGGSGSDPNYV